MATNSNNSAGVGFVNLLTILFIGLKLTGYIDWSWWWVLSPLLFTTGFILAIIGFFSIAYFIKH